MFREPSGTEREEYLRLYQTTLNTPWLPELSSVDKLYKTELEKELSLSSLMACRSLAVAQVNPK